jgi:large conductance mechanosensitive channel
VVTRFAREFKEFISRGSVVDLAIGIVIGAAFTAVVNAFVQDVLNAVIGAVVGKPNFDDLTFNIGDGVVFYGRFLTAVINFVIIGFALFLVVRAINSFRRPEPPAAQQLTEKDVLIEIRDLLGGVRDRASAAAQQPPRRVDPRAPR